MCRHQLDCKAASICEEMELLFGIESPAIEVIKDWIASLTQKKFDDYSTADEDPDWLKQKIQKTKPTVNSNTLVNKNSTQSFFKPNNSNSTQALTKPFNPLHNQSAAPKSEQSESLLVTKFKESLASRQYKSADNLTNFTKIPIQIPIERLFMPKKKLETTKIEKNCSSDTQIAELIKQNESLQNELNATRQKHSSLQTKYDVMFTELKIAVAFSDHSKKSLEKQYFEQIDKMSAYESEINELKKQVSIFDIFDTQHLLGIKPDDYRLFEKDEEENRVEQLQLELAIQKEDFKLDNDELNRRIQEYIRERDDYKEKLAIQSATVNALLNKADAHCRQTTESVKYFEEIKLTCENHNNTVRKLNSSTKQIKRLEEENSHLDRINKNIYSKYCQERLEKERLEDEINEHISSRRVLRSSLKETELLYDNLRKDFDKLESENRTLKRKLKLLKETQQMNESASIRSDDSGVNQLCSDESPRWTKEDGFFENGASFKREREENEEFDNHLTKYLKSHI